MKDEPEFQDSLGNRTKLFGFIGGEKEAFLADNDVVGALHGYGLDIDSRVAGSVEMVREQALLSQSPAFLWPSSSIKWSTSPGRAASRSAMTAWS